MLDAKIVLHVLHAIDPFDQILGATLVFAAVNGSVQCHLAVAHLDVDVRCDEPAILGETIVHILADSIIGAGVASRPTAPMIVRAYLIHPTPTGGFLHFVVRTTRCVPHPVESRRPRDRDSPRRQGCNRPDIRLPSQGVRPEGQVAE